MKRTFVAFVAGALLVAPFITSALTVDELRAQLADLLNRVNQLQGTTGGTSTGGTAVGQTIDCPRISRNLGRGATGDDVSRLQRFLALDPAIYPEAQVTGYYGALTEAAVQRWQTKFHIVSSGTPDTTGFGFTGPRTAAVLALQCPDTITVGGGTNGTGEVGGYVQISPTSGQAPLVVSVQSTVNTTRSCQAATYEVSYGDGTPNTTINVPANNCNELRQTTNHTYNNSGSYTITLRSGVHTTSVTVLVNGGGTPPPLSGSDTMNVLPTSGAAPLSVSFTGVINAAGSCNSGPYSIQFGDDINANIPISGCSAYSYAIAHVYSNPGNYVAHLYRGTPAQDIGSVAIAATGGTPAATTTPAQTNPTGSGGVFSITPGIDGNPLRVQADFALTSSCSRYDLDWGDATAHLTQAEGTCATGAITKSLKHTYTGSGSYTAILKRAPNLTQSDTIGITISN